MTESEDKYVDPVQAMLDEEKASAESASPEPDEDESEKVKAANDADNQATESDSSDDIDTPEPPAETSTDLIVLEKGTDVDSAETLDLTIDGQPEKSRIPLGELLIAKGLISRDQLTIALKVQRDSKDSVMIGATLVAIGFITESALGEILTKDTDIKQFDPKSNIIDPNLIKQVPKDIAQRFSAVPILLEGEKVYVAMTDMYNVLAIDRIKRYFPKRFQIVPIHCSPADLSEIIDNYYDYELSIDGILREMEDRKKEDAAPISAEDGTYTNPTVRLIDALLIDAIRMGASDIHFEPEETFIRLRYRVDGKLRMIRSFHRDYWMPILVRVKIISEMNITETRNPQDGRISLNVLGRQIDFRVATQPTIHGENVVLRILDKAKALLPMDQLGFTQDNIDKLHVALKSPEGIIIVTGPTGSGKTTTLYSILSFINLPDVNIMTLEDPVEYQLPMIRQSNIKSGTGMDFVGGVKSAMRQDPDIIFVGEVRDIDTATMALRAAMTGHQVFTSLHTNDAIGAIPRLIDIGVNPKMLSGSIIACVAQRLARKLCKLCKEIAPATEEEIKILRLDKKNPPELYHHVGCVKCDETGYKGRIAISEIILFDEELNELIAKEATRAAMLRYLDTSGFKGMPDDGTLKVISGMMDLPELIRTINMTSRF